MLIAHEHRKHIFRQCGVWIEDLNSFRKNHEWLRVP
jgi:hypothetical protein